MIRQLKNKFANTLQDAAHRATQRFDNTPEQKTSSDTFSYQAPRPFGQAPAPQLPPRLKPPYVQCAGTQFRDAQGAELLLRGPNLGGWLVHENWMCGITDGSDSVGRFSRETLERRFGAAATMRLLDTWYDRFITTEDLDVVADMGFNVVRVPFGWRNLQHADGTWVRDAHGNPDFSRLDWVVNEAAKRGLYTILDFHMWDTQQSNYNSISEQTPAGDASRSRAAIIWTEVARHFRGHAAIAAFDLINEPTGSYGNVLQDALYKAVRAQDPNRVVIMEGVHAHPAEHHWNQVAYSFHQYTMTSHDFEANCQAFRKDEEDMITKYHAYNVPVYVGEFMAQERSPTLAWMVRAYEERNISWSNWTYKGVDNCDWAFTNLPKSFHVDVLNDPYEHILHTWQNMPRGTPETVVINTLAPSSMTFLCTPSDN